jgi:hypothetical protein
VDPIDLAHEAEALDVDELGLEHAGRHRAGARAELFQRLDQAEVLPEVDLARDLQQARRDHPLIVDALVGHARLGEGLVDLRAGAVEHDRVQPHALKEGQRRGEGVEILGEDAARGLDDRELLRVDAGVLLEVLLDLLAAAEVAEQADDDVLRVAHRSPPRMRR